MKTLSATPRPLYLWKRENVLFLYLLILGGQYEVFVN
jgi:hypothetical protein